MSRQEYMIDVASLMDFKARRDAKIKHIPYIPNLDATCARHAYNQVMPMVLTKSGYICTASYN